MKIKICLVALFLNLCYFGSVAQEQTLSESEITTFKEAVMAVAKEITTLSADFVQYKHMDFLSKDVETSGSMIFKAPGLLQWQYKKPYQYTIVFKNGKILINDEGKKNVVDVGNSKLFGKINRLIAGSVSGNMFDDKEFVIAYLKTKEYTLVRFIPKDVALKKYIKQIELTFNKTDHTVVQIKLLESSQDYTRIILKNKVINANIEDAVFTN